MNEPQVWILILVFSVGLFGLLTLISTMFIHVLRSEVGSLRSEMTTELRSIHHRIDRLDSDISALMRHTFGIERSD